MTAVLGITAVCSARAADDQAVVPQSADGVGPAWTPLFQGIDHMALARGGALPVSLQAVRIDLEADGIAFVSTPPNGDKPGETDSMKPSTFLLRQKCQVAINASPFSPVSREEGEPQDILGLSITGSEIVSGPHPKYGALIISGRTARIVTPPYAVTGVETGVGGFAPLLEKGTLLGEEAERHPRSAAGVSEDGRYLYLLVVDGRQPGYSVGTTTRETAIWMKWLGAYDALNLDGGGSTTLIIEDSVTGFRVMNRPVHNGVPGTERSVGNCLGVFANPLN